MADLIDTRALKESLTSISLPNPRIPSASAVRATFQNIEWTSITKGDFHSVEKIITEVFPMDTKALKNSLSHVIRPGAAKEANEFITAAGTVASAGGIKATFAVMGQVDDAKELTRFGKLAKSFGNKTGSVVRLLGNSAIKLGKLAYWISSIALAVLCWLLSAAWTIWFLLPSKKLPQVIPQ